MIPSLPIGERTLHLLIADEDVANRDLVEAVLTAYGYVIMTAGNGLAAWNLVREESIDLAIVDLNLPGLDGYDFIARCRASEELKQLPILVMSSSTEDTAAERALGLGATGYLTKPLIWPVLAHNVWYMLHNETRAQELRLLRSRLGMNAAVPIELAH